jgi:hypothetical protein
MTGNNDAREKIGAAGQELQGEMTWQKLFGRKQLWRLGLGEIRESNCKTAQ